MYVRVYALAIELGYVNGNQEVKLTYRDSHLLEGVLANALMYVKSFSQRRIFTRVVIQHPETLFNTRENIASQS